MPIGKFFKPVFPKSKLVSYFNDPIQSGSYYNLFLAKASYFSLTKFCIAAGNLVSLFLDRSKKVNFVKFLKL